jgi:hypothetical protein
MHFVKYDKPISAETIIKEAQARIEWLDYTRRLYLLTIKVLFPKWEGKKITRHAFNDFNAVLAPLGYECRYDNSLGSQFYFVVFSKQIRYGSGQARFFMGYDSHPYLEKAFFIEHNKGYDNLDNAIEKIGLGISAVPKLVERWNAALKELQAINTEAEKYKLEYTFDIQDK